MAVQESSPHLLPCLHLSCGEKPKCKTCNVKYPGKLDDYPIAPCFNESGDRYCYSCGEYKKIIATKYCRQCCFFLCEIHEKSHELTERTQHHELLEVKDSLEMPVFLKCRKHSEPITTYCFTCGKPTCEVCLIVHPKHKIKKFEESKELETLRILKDKEALQTNIEKDERMLEEAEQIKHDLLKNRDDTLDAVDNCIKAHILALEKRRIVLRKQVKELSETRLVEIDDKIGEFTRHRNRCKEAIEFSTKATETAGNEIVEISSTILFRISNLRLDTIVKCLTSPVIYLYTEKSTESPYSLPYILGLGKICDGRPRKMFGGNPTQEEIDGDAALWKRIFHEKFPEEKDWKWNDLEEVVVKKTEKEETISDSSSTISTSSSDID